MAKQGISKTKALALNVQNMLELLGIGNEHGTKETPLRVAKMLQEFTKPFDARSILKDFEHVGHGKNGYSGMVVQSRIPFSMLCEHHLLPAIGEADLGYVPGDRVLGLSKLTRLVDAIGHERPSLQEAICDRITDTLEHFLKPKGVMCVITAEHGCMACRGVKAPGVFTTTSSLRGVFREVPQARAEFFSLAEKGRNHG